MSFLIATSGVVLILMPLKLLQVKQSKKINLFLEEKNIILNRKNNTNSVLAEIANKRYNYVFTSPKIVLSKKFKQNIMDCFFFTKRLYLLTVDQIHLVKKWGKNFWLIYVEIEKV